MARVTYGAVVTELRGKIGGTVFQKNAYGFTAKNSPNMVRPYGNKVVQKQSYLREVTQAWRSMTDAQRTAFNSYAATFPQYAENNPNAQLSGYAIFVKWNLIRLTVGLTLSTVLDPVDISFVTVNPTVNSNSATNPTLLEVDLNDVDADPDSGWGIFLSSAVSPGRYFHPQNMRWIISEGASSGSNDIQVPYLAAFGKLPVQGSYVFVKTVPFGIIAPKFAAVSYFRVKVGIY